MHGLLCCLSHTRTKPKSANSNEKGHFDAQNTAQLAELHMSSPACSHCLLLFYYLTGVSLVLCNYLVKMVFLIYTFATEYIHISTFCVCKSRLCISKIIQTNNELF